MKTTKSQNEYRSLAPTLTHEQLLKAGYVPFDGEDGFSQFLNERDAGITIQKFKDKSRYGSAPQWHRFGGSRLSPVYWKKTEIAMWLTLRYGHSDKALLKKAAKAGFVLDQNADAPVAPQPVRRRAGTRRKAKVRMPRRIWEREN